MKSSCINNPKNDQLIVIRKWQIDYCGGNHCAAALLGFLSYWHDIRIESSFKSKQYNDIALKHGEDGNQDTSLYQFHTAQQLKDGLLGLYGDGAIRAARKLLCDLGCITEHKNPNPRYAFDSTLHFMFHPEIVNKWLESRVALVENDTSLVENDTSLVENDGRSLENDGTSNKITNETTLKEQDQITSCRNSKVSTSEPKRSKFVFTDDDKKAAEWMASRVLIINPTAKQPNLESWANDIRIMRQMDERTLEDICVLFNWANKDSFWCVNILSPKKLRAKWDQLAAKAINPQTNANVAGSSRNRSGDCTEAFRMIQDGEIF